MLDKTLPYYHIVMVLPAGRNPCTQPPDVPDGYRLHLYRPGEESLWAELEASVGEFPGRGAALSHFNKEFAPFPAETARRMVFLTDSQGAPAATASAWTDAETGAPILHWVSTAPRRQGRGLGRAATQHALYLHHKLAPGAAISLHTQTWSHKAVLLYASLGFRMVQGKTPVCGKPNEYDQAMAVLRRVYPPGVSHALEEQALRADEF